MCSSDDKGMIETVVVRADVGSSLCISTLFVLIECPFLDKCGASDALIYNL